jgi:hypothetical protein
MGVNPISMVKTTGFVTAGDNLVGADFLQQTKTTLDYSKSDDEVFRGNEGQVGCMHRVRMSPDMRRQAEQCLRRLLKKLGADSPVDRLSREVRSALKK